MLSISYDLVTNSQYLELMSFGVAHWPRGSIYSRPTVRASNPYERRLTDVREHCPRHLAAGAGIVRIAVKDQECADYLIAISHSAGRQSDAVRGTVFRVASYEI